MIETGLTGLEPATSAVTGRCSNQLNYSPMPLDSSQTDENHWEVIVIGRLEPRA